MQWCEVLSAAKRIAPLFEAVSAKTHVLGGRLGALLPAFCLPVCLSADVHVLGSLPWCSVVVDRRQRSRSAAGKAQLALQVRSGYVVLGVDPAP